MQHKKIKIASAEVVTYKFASGELVTYNYKESYYEYEIIETLTFIWH